MILEPLARGDEAPGVGVDAPAQLAGDIEGFSLIVKQLAFALSVTGQRGWDIEEPAARVDPVFNVRAHRKGAHCAGFAHGVLLGERPRTSTESRCTTPESSASRVWRIRRGGYRGRGVVT